MIHHSRVVSDWSSKMQMHRMKPIRHGLYKNINKPTNVTWEFSTQNEKCFPSHGNHLIPYYPKDPLFFPRIQSHHEQIPISTSDSDTSDMVHNHLYTSNDTLELNDKICDDDPLCDDNDGIEICFDDGLYKSVNLVDFHHPFWSESDSDFFCHKTRSSKLQSLKTFLQAFGLPDTCTVLDSTTSIADETNFLCVFSNHKPPIVILEPIMIHDHNREKTFVFFIHQLLLPIDNCFHETRSE